MKDLKSYFTPHEEPKNRMAPDQVAVKRSRREEDAVSVKKAKKPKKKRKVEESDLEESSPKSSDGSKENDEESNSLFNYFGKVTPAEAQRQFEASVRPPSVFKVEAVVHHPIDVPKKIVKKKRLRRRPHHTVEPEYDVITSEEDVTLSILVEDPAEIDLTIEDDVVLLSETTETPLRPKHDGTLTSYFKIGDRTKVNPKRQAEVKRCELTSAPFPLISHIQQKLPMNLIWNLTLEDLHFAADSPATIQIPPWSKLIQFSEEKTVLLPQKPKNGLKSLKSDNPGLPVASWYKDLQTCSDSHVCWTDKFFPQKSSQMLSNSKQIRDLKSWLVEMKTVNLDGGPSSGDEFEESRVVKSAALIIGPPGCGKTSCVYALAQEIGYSVLELNASSCRTGKKIWREFSEALQSHKVKTKSPFVLQSDPKLEKEGEPKHSLILIEDADIVFDNYDEGFYSTVTSFAATSKRPIVFVANSEPAIYPKIRPSLQLEVSFALPSPGLLAPWLRTIALTQKLHLTQAESSHLVSWAQSDTRKCINQLHFNSVSSAPFIWSRTPVQLNSVNYNWLALVDMAEAKKWRKLRLYEPKLRDSTELTDTELPVESSLTHEIIDFSREKGMVSDLPINADTTIYDKLQNVVSRSKLLCRSSVSTDYYPYVRSICRSEKERLRSQSTRNIRHFHYFSSVEGCPTLDQIITVFPETE